MRDFEVKAEWKYMDMLGRERLAEKSVDHISSNFSYIYPVPVGFNTPDSLKIDPFRRTR